MQVRHVFLLPGKQRSHTDTQGKFRKHVQTSKFYKMMTENIRGEFLKSIPSSDIKELPTLYMYTVGTIVHLVTLALFFYFLWGGYQKGISDKFLSLQSNAGVCNEVLRAGNGVFLADYDGNWQGSSQFSYVKAMYSFHLSNFLTTYRNYNKVIGVDLYEIVEAIGRLALTKNLAFNLLIWMSWNVFYDDGRNIQVFQMASSPDIIFNRAYQHGTLGNYFGECTASSKAQFDPATNIISLRYAYDEFVSNPTCSNTLNPMDLGYRRNYDGNDFILRYDVRTLSTAVAVNARIIFLTNLIPIPQFLGSYTYKGVEYTVGYYYDSRYPGMAPVTCAIDNTNPTEKYVCGFLINNDIYAFPLFDHFGASFESPEYCSCETGTGYLEECNAFNFLSGFLLFSNGTGAWFNPLLDLVSAYNVSTINSMAYYAMYAGANVGVNSSLDALFQSAAYRSLAYDFCSMSNGEFNCTIVTVNSYDVLTHSVNSHYNQLVQGSCADSFSTPHFQRLAEKPPIAIKEHYYECRQTIPAAFLDSLGIASGSTSTFIPLVVFVCVCCVLLLNRMRGKLTLRLYDREDRDRILEMMALQLLLLRDKQISNVANGEGESSILVPLLKELQKHCEDPMVMNTASDCGVHSSKSDFLSRDNHTTIENAEVEKAEESMAELNEVGSADGISKIHPEPQNDEKSVSELDGGIRKIHPEP